LFKKNYTTAKFVADPYPLSLWKNTIQKIYNLKLNQSRGGRGFRGRKPLVGGKL